MTEEEFMGAMGKQFVGFVGQYGYDRVFVSSRQKYERLPKWLVEFTSSSSPRIDPKRKAFHINEEFNAILLKYKAHLNMFNCFFFLKTILTSTSNEN